VADNTSFMFMDLLHHLSIFPVLENTCAQKFFLKYAVKGSGQTEEVYRSWSS